MILILAGNGFEAEKYAKDQGLQTHQRNFVNSPYFFRGRPKRDGDELRFVGTWSIRPDAYHLRKAVEEAGWAWQP